MHTCLLEALVLGERVRRLDLVTMAAIAAGLALVLAGLPPATTTAPNPVLGNAAAVASGMAWALVDWPGPFHVFGGNWMPIDV